MYCSELPKTTSQVQDVFNIITHPKFSSGVAEKYGKRMLQTVAESMDLFSDKQRITLSRQAPGCRYNF